MATRAIELAYKHMSKAMGGKGEKSEAIPCVKGCLNIWIKGGGEGETEHLL